MNIRPAAVAGSFYPADQAQLRASVIELLKDNPCNSTEVPKAIVAPHAGYIYSGPTAASVYNLLHAAADKIRRVVLLGPAHRVPLGSMALPTCKSFATPLGEIPVDIELRDRVTRLDLVTESEPAHAFEHSLEVHLPFLQTVLTSFTLLPIVVGVVSADKVAKLIDTVWGEGETLIVISTDLSHFMSYDRATEYDEITCKKILDCNTHLQGDQACGCFSLNGMLKTASRRQMQISLIDYRNSGDTAGSRDRVVGYGAFALYEH
ncbi:MAG: AmmeMemoRadiSam system protein B [Gammaproteobacteria bacterium]